LLLPAFSTVSTRKEMLGLAESLASDFQAVTLDIGTELLSLYSMSNLTRRRCG